MKSSLKNWFQFPYFDTFFLFLLFFIFFSTTSVSSSKTPTISYSDHCASIIPEATPTTPDYNTTAYLILQPATTHFSGGERILGKNSSEYSSFNYEKSVSFRVIRKAYKTSSNGVYKIEAFLNFRSYHSRVRPRRGLLRFMLHGFWSESSGKLCMVGSASSYSKEGNLLNLDSVFKLNYAKNSNISTSLVSGILESLSSINEESYFEPISILAFPQIIQYNYTLVSGEFDKGCSGGIDIPPNSSLSLQPQSFCSVLSFWYNPFKLDYGSKCNPLKNCTPFGEGIGYLPNFMSLNTIQCSLVEQKLRFLVGFQNSSSYMGYRQSFDPNTTFVGEGSWDKKKNRLCIVACRKLNETVIGDCSIRLSLRFPAVWSIRKSFSIEGQIWTNKTVNESGYFDKIMFRSSDNGNSMMGVPGLKYEYTEMDRVKKFCPVKKHGNKKGEEYPSGHSYDMRFDMSIRNSKGYLGWGSAAPISVGDQFYGTGPVQDYSEIEGVPAVVENTSYSAPLNISYQITLTIMRHGHGVPSFNFSLSPQDQFEISAEGIYDAETGYLCMVGCRNVGTDAQNSKNDTVDCEILVNFQFPPVNGRNASFIQGSIKSMRKNNDPLYFGCWNMSSNAFYTDVAKQSIWRMDLEIVMVLISNTLACVFVGLQLFHVKKHPDVLPFISLFMLVILTLGHMIPLVLNFEALFLGNRNRQNVLLGSDGWLEVNEVIVRVVTMIAFLLQFRLLQLAWTARLGVGNEKDSWVAEKKALFVCLPLYLLGGSIALLVNWRKNSQDSVIDGSWIADYHQHSLWGALRSYAGLVLDGFLFPQILLNMFKISKERSLSKSFYVGTTFVRLLPHAYDLYRTHNYARRHFDGSYIYANPSADFYSSAWDVIIPLGGMIFAAIIFLQQRFGGRCLLTRRFRELELYEKVPVVSSE